MASPARPLELISACQRHRDGHAGFWVNRKYLDAVRLADAEPWIAADAAEAAADLTQPRDPLRDAWALPLAREAVALGMPLFGIRRELQAFGEACQQRRASR